MITNPQVGMRVKCVCKTCRSQSTRLHGIITRVDNVCVQIRWSSGFSEDYYAPLSHIEIFEPTAEEQDQQRREEHADKYL